LADGAHLPNKYSFYEDGTNNTAYVSVKNQPMTLAKARTDSQGTQELLIGFLGSLAYHIAEGNDLTLRIVGNQSTEDNARFQVQAVNPPSSSRTSPSVRRALAGLGSALRRARLSRRSPSTGSARSTSRVRTSPTALLPQLVRSDEPDVHRPSNSTDALNTRRNFREIDERNGQGVGNVTIPIKPWRDLEGRVKAGAYYESSRRDYTQYSFSYTFPSSSGLSSQRRP
jgi:hypothetical protein